jgi:hypothetical protein
MKPQRLTLTLLAIGYWLLAIVAAPSAAAQATNAPLRELIFQTKAATNLNATSLRVTVSEFSLDRTLTLNVEKRSTNNVIIDRELVEITDQEIKKWCSTNAPRQYLKGLILEKVSLADNE